MSDALTCVLVVVLMLALASPWVDLADHARARRDGNRDGARGE
jgi:hypothetical protein